MSQPSSEHSDNEYCPPRQPSGNSKASPTATVKESQQDIRPFSRHRQHSGHGSRSPSFNDSAAEVILGLFQESTSVDAGLAKYAHEDPAVRAERIQREAQDSNSWVRKTLARPGLWKDEDDDNEGESREYVEEGRPLAQSALLAETLEHNSKQSESELKGPDGKISDANASTRYSPAPDPGRDKIDPDPSPTSSRSSGEFSLDFYGQPRWGGTGQGAPLDENGCYIYSQAYWLQDAARQWSPMLSPSPHATSPHGEGGTSEVQVIVASKDNVTTPTLKRRRSDEWLKASSEPIQLFRPIKRRRLRSPLDLSSGNKNTVGLALEKLQKDVGKQTEILTAILAVLRERNGEA